MSSVEFHKFRENIKNINDYTDQKEKIFDNFIDQGLPNKRNESWKYFDLVSKSKKYIKNDISNSEIIVEDLEEKNIFYDYADNNLSIEDYFKPCNYFKSESVVDLNVACGNQIKILDIKDTQNEPIIIKINYNEKNISLPRLIINIADNMKNLSMPIESSRLQLFSNHIGEKSSCSSKTISIPSENSNDDILVDNIFSKSNCESVSGVRAILDKDSVCSFQSMIDIHNSVLGSKAEQDCKGFLLSDKAVMNAKPQMKIFNDDVICKHGATIGSLNEEEIFYLCARGLERKNAINLILDGHISSYIGEKGFLREFLPEEYK